MELHFLDRLQKAGKNKQLNTIIQKIEMNASNNYKDAAQAGLREFQETLRKLEAAGKLEEKGVAARVVSMPCMDLFDEQREEYKESVLPKSVRARVAVEAASSMCWASGPSL